MTELQLTVEHADGRAEARTVPVARIANLGMAGREDPPADVLESQRRRMAEAGVERQREGPSIVPKPAHLITTAETIQVNSANTAGEAEFVLFPTGDATYVGVGNDHKDRDLEAAAMHKANSTCPSVVGDRVWRLDEVLEHWDELELRSWVEVDGRLEGHQRAPMTAFMPPREILERVDRRTTAPIEGTAIWSGTVGVGEAAVDPFPAVVAGPFYLVQLYDPVLDRRLTAGYEVTVNDWIEGVDLSTR